MKWTEILLVFTGLLFLIIAFVPFFLVVVMGFKMALESYANFNEVVTGINLIVLGLGGILIIALAIRREARR